MGATAYCCAQSQPNDASPLQFKRKASLVDPQSKRKYEKKLSQVLNKALDKFNQGKKVRKIHLKSEIGKGGQGDILLADMTLEDKNGDIFTKQYAMKRMPKSRLIHQRTKEALILENQILANHNSDFLAHIQYAFQDDSYLYYMMNVAKGGDLYGFIYSNQEFLHNKCREFQNKGQNGLRFMIAGIILGLEYLNKKDIIYRDLKPQNILIFQDGYPRLADFGIVYRPQKSQLCYDIKGTTLYFSPQMINKTGYDRGHDLWTLGVLIYQLVFKQVPFRSDLIKSKIFQSFVKKWSVRNIDLLPVSEQIIDLISSLLKVKPSERLGYNSYQEIKQHIFFKDFNWEQYEKKQIASPFAHIIQEHPITFKPLSQQIDELTDLNKCEKISFTFIREQVTRAYSNDRLQRTSSQQDDLL